MGTYIIVYEPGRNMDAEYTSFTGDNILEGMINNVGSNEGTYFEAIETMYLQEKPDLSSDKIGMLEFYELFIENNNWPIPIKVLDITDPKQITELTQYDIEQIWNNRNIEDNLSNDKGVDDVDPNQSRELS